MFHRSRIVPASALVFITWVSAASADDFFGAPLPPGAIARMESARQRVQRNLNTFAVAMSADGKLLASDGVKGQIRLWNPTTGEELPTPVPMQGDRPLAFAPDGKHLAAATGNRGGVRVYEVATGKVRFEFQDHTDFVWALAYSPDGKLLLAADRTPKTVVWDLQTGQVKATLEVRDAVRSAVFAPDGNTVALACVDTGIRLWDVAALKERLRLEGHDGQTWAATFTRDGRTLITGGYDSTIRLWDVTTGKQLKVIQEDFPVQGLAVNAEATRLLSGGQGGRVHLRDLTNGKLLSRTPPHYGPTWAIALTPDGKHVAWADQSQTVKFAAIVGDKLELLPEKRLAVFGLAFSWDGKTLTTVGDDTLRVWESATGKELVRAVTAPFAVKGLARAKDGKTLFLGCTDRTVRVRDGIAAKDRLVLRGHQHGVPCLDVAPDGTLAVGSGKIIHLWNTATGAELRQLAGHDAGVTGVAFAHDGAFLATASEDKTVRLWDARTGAEVRRFTGHASPVNCVALFPDGKTAVSGSWDGAVRIWETATGKEVRKLAGHHDNISAVVCSPDGRLLATASWDKSICLWSKAGKLVATVTGHEDEVTALAFSPDGKRLASASRDHTVLVWDVARFK